MNDSQQNQSTPSQEKKHVVVTSTKSVGISLILTFLFGPLGMLYSTIIGGIVMIIISLVVAPLTAFLGLFLIWPISMIWGAIATSSYNKKLLKQAS